MHSAFLTRKEVRSRFGIHPTTLWRWEKEGLPFLRGRITEAQLAWWLEQAEAARRLGLRILDFLTQPREEREKLLEKDHRSRHGRN